jgi:peptidoglycan/LPS O-acetylase OafA/YrhL
MNSIPSSIGSSTVRITALEGLRGLAFLVVHAFHSRMFGPAYGVSPYSKTFHFATDYGWVGVDLFFVLSGFLITGILLRQVGTPGWVGRFYERRALRILPIYFLVLVGTVWIAPLFMHWLLPLVEAPRADFIWYATFLHNWLNLGANGWPRGDNLIGQLWSLAVEEQFYLIWPALIALFGVRRIPFIAVAVLLLAPAARMLLGANGYSYDVTYALTICRADALAAGALLAIAVSRRSVPSSGWTWSMILIGGGLFVLTPFLSQHVPDSLQIHVRNAGFTWGLLMWSGFLVKSLGQGWIPKALSWKPLRWVGFYSYTLYLVSFPLSFVLGAYWKAWLPESSLRNQSAFFVATLAISMAISWVSWHLLEKRLLSLRGQPPLFR